MFMLKSTHRSIVEAMRSHTAKRIDDYRRTIEKSDAARFETQNLVTRMEGEIADLRELLAERQVPAVRGSRGRFVKREG